MAGRRKALRLHHVALRVVDCARSLAFYAGLLGWRVTRRREDGAGLASAWLRHGGITLMIERGLRGSGPASGSGHVLVFAVDDLGEWERRLAEAGVAVHDRTAHTLYFCDPDGHRLGLSKYRDDS